MFAVWLLFEDADSQYLSDTILKLSKQYSSPVFLPHITIYGLVDIDLNTLDNIVLQSINGEKPIPVEKNMLSHSDDFWKTLYVDLILNTSLQRIHKRLLTSLQSFTQYDFKPHVSLIYKQLPQNEKKFLANTLEIKNTFKVSSIAIQEFSKDIEKWKVVKRHDFLQYAKS